MKTFSDLRQLIDQVERHYGSLNSIRLDEIKEFGDPKPDTCHQMNAILYNISKACECLNRGLNDEF